MKKLTNRQKAYMVDYQKTHLKKIKLQLNIEHDADILEWLESQPNKNAYLKTLIRQDMEKIRP